MKPNGNDLHLIRDDIRETTIFQSSHNCVL